MRLTTSSNNLLKAGDLEIPARYHAVASLLAGLAWPIAMCAVPLRRPGRIMGVLLALQTVSIGVWSGVSAFTLLIDTESPVPLVWHVGGELLAVALVARCRSLLALRDAQARTSRRSTRVEIRPVSLPRRPCDART